MDLTYEDLASFNPEKSAWVIEDGQYAVIIGSSSEDTRQIMTFNMGGNQLLKKVSKSLIPKQEITVIDVNK